MLTEIISNITGSFSELMTNMISALSSGFDALVWTTNESGAKELSSLATYGLVFIGIGLAVGLVWFVTGLIKG